MNEFVTYSVAAVGIVAGGLLVKTYRFSGQCEQALSSIANRMNAAGIQLYKLQNDISHMREFNKRKASLRHAEEKLRKIEAELTAMEVVAK